jgi:hypothetical protein
MRNQILRVTPLMVVADLNAAAQHFCTLGFEPVETREAGVIGLQAGSSQMILASVEHMEMDFRPMTVATIAGRTVPYIYVRSMTAAMANLPEGVIVIEKANTHCGTVEAVIGDAGNFRILVEELGSPA